ncbi:MAG: hypothetical protein ACJA0Q_000442, partial [Saprospiraceae bacterium]
MKKNNYLLSKSDVGIYPLVLLVSFLFIGHFSQAQPFVSNGTAVPFTTATGWTPNGVPNLTFWDGSHDVTMSHSKTIAGFTISCGTATNVLTIQSGATLTVAGSISVNAGGRLVVEGGGTLIVNGSITCTSSGVIVSNGTITATGNVIVNTGGTASFLGTTTITGSVNQDGIGSFITGGTFDVGTNLTVNSSGVATLGGTVNVPGDMTVSGSGGAVVTGDVRVTGTLHVLNDSKVTGTGTIGWGISDVNPACSPARVICQNLTEYDDNACTAAPIIPMPFNPLDLSTCAAVVVCGLPSVGGTVTLNASVCSGTNGANLTLAGETGTVLRWEWSTDNWGTTNVIANITNTQAYLNLVTTTKYRAVVQSGACAAANSVEATITVNALPVPTLTLGVDAACIDGAALNLTGGLPA